MIPKLIHQTAKDRNIPPKWQGYQKKLQDLHPGWIYKLWTDEDNLAFVKKEFPDFLDIYQKLPRGIMRADVIRYLLMFKLGGLYMDLDYEMLKPFDLTDKEIVLPWESSGEFGPGNERLGNSFFASRPGHPFFKMAIDDLTKNPPLAQDVEILSATGPLFITRMYHAAKAAGIDLFTPERPLFNPPTPRSPRQYRAILKQNIAYGIHHCHGTWREYSFPRRVKNKVVSAIKWFF